MLSLNDIISYSLDPILIPGCNCQYKSKIIPFKKSLAFQGELSSVIQYISKTMELYFKTTNILSIVDYGSFAGLLFISALVGLYYALVDRKVQSTTSGYFLGDRKMHPLPVGFSLWASFISAILMLGGPAEVYTQGTMVLYGDIATLISLFAATCTFIPLFQRLHITSIFQVGQSNFLYAH